MKTRWQSWIPAIFVLLLLAAALVAPGRRAGAKSGPVMDLYYPNCTWVTEGGVGGGPYVIAQYEGLAQPLSTTNNIATVVMTMDSPEWSGVYDQVVYWDPVALAPVAGQIALRSNSGVVTNLATNYSRSDFFPPLITKVLSSVAEPPPAQIAYERGVFYGNARTVTLSSNDGSSLPSALRINADGTRTPLPGAHPVFWHTECGGDQMLQDLRVLQSVMTCNFKLSRTATEHIQKFRVPVAASVRWIELAYANGGMTGGLDWGRVRILDAAGQIAPPVTFGPAIFDAQISYYPFEGWGSHVDVSAFPTLEANRDYWLVVNPVGDYTWYAKYVSGSESPFFSIGIGTLFTRSTAGGAATPVANRALDFRIIGTPTTTVGVDPVAPAPSRTIFELAVAPNPARGVAAVSWSGAHGGVRFEVLDARGRRVAQGMNAQGESGRWSWNAAGDDGRALPAGLYFVRARDEAGRSTSSRVTIVR